MHAVARWTEAPALKPGPIELPGVDPGGARARARRRRSSTTARRSARSAQLIGGSRRIRRRRVAALKSADAVLRAGFAR